MTAPENKLETISADELEKILNEGFDAECYKTKDMILINSYVENFGIPYLVSKKMVETGLSYIDSNEETAEQKMIDDFRNESMYVKKDKGFTKVKIDEDIAETIAEDIVIHVKYPYVVEFLSNDGKILFSINKKHDNYYLKGVNLSTNDEVEDEFKFNTVKQKKSLTKSVMEIVKLITQFDKETSYDKDELNELVDDFGAKFHQNKTQIENLAFGNQKLTKENDKTDENGNYKAEDGTILHNNHKKFSGLYLPSGYTIYPTMENGKIGIYDIYGNHICSTPCIVTDKVVNIDGSNDEYKLTFIDVNGNKRHIVVKQDALLTNRGIEGLISRGIRVDSANTKNLSKFYREAMDFNNADMGTSYSVDNNGWKKNNTTFVFGDKAFTKDGIFEVYQSDESINGKNLQSKGNIDTWKDSVQDLLQYDLVRFKIYVAASAFILQLLGADNIILNHWGKSSTGKTFTTILSFSFFGNPNKDGLMNSDTTKYAAEYLAYLYCDLPLYFDELTNLNIDVGQFLYTLGNGVSKRQGKQTGGLKNVNEFNTATFITAERQLEDEDMLEGQKLRLIETDDKLPDGLGKEISRAKHAIKFNYGFLAEPYIMKIFEKKDELEAMYFTAQDRFKNLSDSGKNFDDRLANTFAVIEVAGKLIEEVLKSNGFESADVEQTVDKYFVNKTVDNAVEESDIVMLRHLNDWNMQKINHFVSPANPCVYGDVYGWIEKGYMDIPTSVLKNALKQYEKGNLTRIFKEWKDKGIIITNSGKTGHTYKAHGRNVYRFVESEINKALDLNYGQEHYEDDAPQNDVQNKLSNLSQLNKIKVNVATN
jgi:uncharacterized protein (DUF927 family)